MAVTIIVEDGTGVAGANVYDTFANVSAYFVNNGYDWTTSPEPSDEQLAAMIRGASALDRLYGPRLGGSKVGGRAQSLLFPRQGLEDAECEDVPEDEVPVEWKTAFYELSWREYNEPGSLSPDYLQSQRVVSETLGPLSVTYSSTDTGVEGSQPVLTAVDGILYSLLGAPVSLYFGKIERV